jgi:hypothetical protein
MQTVAFNDQPWAEANLLDGNFMTPKVVKRGRRGDWAWEISRGEGLDREPIFGVTFLLWDGNAWTRRFDDDQLTYSLPEARTVVARVTG